MIANTLVVVSPRLRYWAQFMLIPRSINKRLDADIQALIRNKDIKFDADEDSTEKVNRRFMIKGAEYNSTQELGLGLSRARASLCDLGSFGSGMCSCVSPERMTMASEETSFRLAAISAAPMGRMGAIAVFERVRELGRSGSSDGCVSTFGMPSTELGVTSSGAGRVCGPAVALTSEASSGARGGSCGGGNCGGV